MIREYTAADLESVLDIWYRASGVAHPFLSDDFMVAERKRIQEQWLPISETVVYERDGVVVGFLSLVGTEVGGLFVDPDHQRRGTGRALMDAASGVRPFLELSVFEANAVGRAFYASYGFQVIGRRINEDTGHPELRLRLDPVAG